MFLQILQILPDILFINTNEVSPHEEGSTVCVISRAQENLAGVR